MKLRIKGNSIRLRLTRPEVANVASEGRIVNITDIGERRLSFVLAADDQISTPAARFEGDAIVVCAPRDVVSAWASGDEVGIYGEQAVPGGDSLRISIEKDFRCLDRSRAEGDEADAYPHPAIKSRDK